MTSPILTLDLLTEGQANGDLTFNEAIRVLEALLHNRIADRDLTAPPTLAGTGLAYIIAAGGSGAWSGHDLKVAIDLGDSWAIITPPTGALYWIADEAALFYWNGSAWTSAGGGETNTASNSGTGGVGPYARKTGADLEFKNLNAGDGSIVVTDDTVNDEIDIKVADGGVSTAKLADDAVTAAKIAAGAVGTSELAASGATYAKIQDVSATDRVLGRSSAGAGVVEEIVCSAAGRAIIDDADAPGRGCALLLGQFDNAILGAAASETFVVVAA